MNDTVLFLVAIVATILWVVPFLLVARRWRMRLQGSGKFERERWEMYAGEHHHTYGADPRTPKIRGVHHGVSFEVVARVFKRRTRYGPATEYATATLRATHRAALPPGFIVRKASWGLSLGSLVAGHRAMDADPEYEALRIESDDEPAAQKLLADPGLRAGILSLFDALPTAVVHERAIDVPLPPMHPDLRELDGWLDKATSLAAALRAFAPQVDRAPAAVGQALKPMPTAAELPERHESLSVALRRVNAASSRTSAGVQASSMRVRPYEYELEVRVIDEATTRLGVPSGGKLVRGLLARSPWRAEIAFPPADNALVEALRPTDVIGGLALIDDFRAVAQVVECTAQTPPIVKIPAAHPDAAPAAADAPAPPEGPAPDEPSPEGSSEA